MTNGILIAMLSPWWKSGTIRIGSGRSGAEQGLGRGALVGCGTRGSSLGLGSGLFTAMVQKFIYGEVNGPY